MDNTATNQNRIVEIGKIMEMIPHRYPFLLVDKVIDLVPDATATGIKNVTMNEPFFQGHFPDHPIMPGVLIVEAMAQTSAILVIETTGKKASGVVYFMTIEQARFRQPVVPGDRLELHVEKQRSRGNVWKFRGEAKVDQKLVAEANYSAMIVDEANG